ncbi:MAG: transposase [Methanomicrobiaceae archaeon]|nr:transposase [Methanomicrobiaceae archaeon]
MDLNTTGHLAVVAVPKNGEVIKLGKKSRNYRSKLSQTCFKLRKEKKFREIKRIRNRERSLVKDLNQMISRAIVETARCYECGIKLERLFGTGGNRKKQGYTLEFHFDTRSFYQLQRMVESKARKAGVPVAYIDPSWTSTRCRVCGQMGIRHRKRFECPHCGHADHADVNAAFNIAATPVLEGIC